MDGICADVGFYDARIVLLAVIGALVAAFWLEDHFFLAATPGALALSDAQIRIGCGRLGYWSESSLIWLFIIVVIVSGAAVRVYKTKAQEKRDLQRRLDRLEEETRQHGGG